MTKKDFFYCYDKRLFKYLHDIKGIDYITIAINPTTQKVFSVFTKSEQLQMALDRFNAKKMNF